MCVLYWMSVLLSDLLFIVYCSMNIFFSDQIIFVYFFCVAMIFCSQIYFSLGWCFFPKIHEHLDEYKKGNNCFSIFFRSSTISNYLFCCISLLDEYFALIYTFLCIFFLCLYDVLLLDVLFFVLMFCFEIHEHCEEHQKGNNKTFLSTLFDEFFLLKSTFFLYYFCVWWMFFSQIYFFCSIFLLDGCFAFRSTFLCWQDVLDQFFCVWSTFLCCISLFDGCFVLRFTLLCVFSFFYHMQLLFLVWVFWSHIYFSLLKFSVGSMSKR